MPALHEYAKAQKAADVRSGACIWGSVRCQAPIISLCSIMDGPPAADLEATPQRSARSFSSPLKRTPSRLLRGSKAPSFPPLFLVFTPCPFLIISWAFWGWFVDLGSSEFALLVARGCFEWRPAWFSSLVRKVLALCYSGCVFVHEFRASKQEWQVHSPDIGYRKRIFAFPA